jgi:hypothetical protein
MKTAIEIERSIVFLNTNGIRTALAANGYTGSHIEWTTFTGLRNDRGQFLFEADCRPTCALRADKQMVRVFHDGCGIVASYVAEYEAKS